MKHILLLIFIALCSFSTWAQDLIITNAGDSINCRIHQVRADQIIYIEQINGRYEGQTIDKSAVAYYQHSSQSVENKEIEEIDGNAPVEPMVQQRSVKENYSKVHFAVGGGLGYQLGRINPNVPDFLESYVDGLRTGPHFSSELAFFVDRGTAFGAKFSRFSAKNETQIVANTGPSGQLRTSTMNDKITIIYVGPMLCFRAFNNRNHNNYFLFDLSLGYINYQNRALFLHQFYRIHSHTLGFSLGTSYNVNSIQLKASLISGSLNYLNVYYPNSLAVIEFDENNKETTTRLDFAISFRF